MAVDEESGEATFATVVVEVLEEGQLGMETLSGCSIVAGFHLQAGERSLSVNCSSVHGADGGAGYQLHRGESLVPLHAPSDSSWLHRFNGDVAEKEAEGKAEPAGEGLRGSGQTPQRGEELIHGIFQIVFVLSREKLLKCSLFTSHRAYDGSNW